MKTYGSYAFFLLFSTTLLLGCTKYGNNANDYEEIPSVLNVLTNKVQSSVEQGYFEDGEQAVLEYVGEKNPNVLNWFNERNYEIRVGVVGGYAVVTICDKGKPIFEDTYCNPGKPDKDHRGNKGLKSCEITMTAKEVNGFCQ